MQQAYRHPESTFGCADALAGLSMMYSHHDLLTP